MIKTDNSKVNSSLLEENQRLREQLAAWAEKYADLKIKSDANQWAHDNMQEQLAKELNLKDSWRAVAHKLEQDKLDLKYALVNAKADGMAMFASYIINNGEEIPEEHLQGMLNNCIIEQLEGKG